MKVRFKGFITRVNPSRCLTARRRFIVQFRLRRIKENVWDQDAEALEWMYGLANCVLY